MRGVGFPARAPAVRERPCIRIDSGQEPLRCDCLCWSSTPARASAAPAGARAARSGRLHGSTRRETEMTPTTLERDSFAARREALVAQALVERGIRSELVLGAMRSVPRERFL